MNIIWLNVCFCFKCLLLLILNTELSIEEHFIDIFFTFIKDIPEHQNSRSTKSKFKNYSKIKYTSRLYRWTLTIKISK